jgi:hypothetical protein
MILLESIFDNLDLCVERYFCFALGMPDRRFPPPWTVEELRDFLHRARRRSVRGRLRLFSKRTGPARSRQSYDEGRGAQDRGRHCQAA